MTAPAATLSIGGFSFHEYRDNPATTALAAQYRPFIANTAPSVTCHVHTKPRPSNDTRDWRLVFDASPNWTLHQKHNHLLFQTMFLEALCSHDLNHCDLFPLPDTPENLISFFSYPLAELITISLLARQEGILLHSCGIEVEGRALLFCGPSGIGKSTMAGIWQRHGYRILSDDRVIIRQINNQLVACGTPWHGSAELGSPTTLPLANIYLLGRGSANLLAPINGAHAISLLLQHSFLPFWDKEAMENCLAFFEHTLQYIPCSTLEFLPDEQVIPFLLAAGPRAAGHNF